MVTITSALIQAANPANTTAYCDSLAPSMNDYAQAYAVNTPLRIAHFLSQIGVESGFKVIAENGSYSPARMRQVFGCNGGQKNYDAEHDDCKLGRLRDKLWLNAANYANSPRNLLSYVYASRMGNGDEASGDGFTYRGRGMIQLTGKDKYRAFTASHAAKNPADPRDFVANPDLLSTELKYAVESAFYYWDTNKLNVPADRDDVVAVTLGVNGGSNGLPERRLALARVKKLMGL